jgi:hypothetical protein
LLSAGESLASSGADSKASELCVENRDFEFSISEMHWQLSGRQ